MGFRATDDERESEARFSCSQACKILDQRPRLLLPDAVALGDAHAVDVALDREERIDATHRFERYRRDGCGARTTARRSRDVGEFEEASAGVRPSERRAHGPGLPHDRKGRCRPP